MTGASGFDWAWDLTVVCRPEIEEQLTAALDSIGPTVRHARVRSSRFVPDGKAIVIDDEKMEELLKLPPMEFSWWR